MSRPDPLLDVLRRFARAMTRRYDVNDALYDFCDHSMEVVSAAGAGVGLLDDDGKLRFITATDATVAVAERAQEEHQAGPCLSSIDRCAPVRVADVRDHADEWPEFCAQVTGQGLHAVLGIPLVVDEERIGSLDVYDHRPRVWTDEEVQRASVLADIAAAYVVNATELAESRRTTEQLQRALDSRVVIEQAKGVLAGQLGVSMDAAFTAIRQHARGNGITVRGVSLSVIEQGADAIPR